MNFDSVLNPKSIALVGASRDESSVGFNLYKNLLSPSYTGTVYAINPKADTLLGKPVFHTIEELPEIPDLAILAIPAAYVQQSIEQLAAKGVGSVIIISAGFKEAGDEGKQRETNLLSFCNEHNITVIGPNCLGILNPHIGLNASFETVLPTKGSIAFVSQSGALISALLDIANVRGIGFSKIISVGNKAQVSEHELLPYLFADPETKVILLYAEVLTDATNIIQLVRSNAQSSSPKPVVLLKAGITRAGQKASSSHTGSLAGSDGAYEALVEQAGIIRVKTINELLSTAHILASSPLPKNTNIAIVTNAGGPGIIATDEAERTGLTIPLFTEETETALKQILPAASHVSNPVDVLGDAGSERYDKTLQTVSADVTIESILTIVTPQSMTDIAGTANAVVHAKETSHKLIAASFMGKPHVDEGVHILTEHSIPHMRFPEDAITAISHASAFYQTTQKKYSSIDKESTIPEEAKRIIEDLEKNNVTLVNTETVFKLLDIYNIPVIKSIVVQSAEDAKKMAGTIGDVLAMKIISPDISHKTDVGGVLLNIPKENAFDSFQEIITNVSKNAPNAKTHGILISQMAESNGLELIIGIKREKGLGTLIMVGVGGIYVELIRDTVFRFAPLTDEDAQEMIDSMKAKPLLYGFRGSPKRDIAVLVDILKKISRLAQEIPQIAEFDINPFMLNTEGKSGLVLDARMVLQVK